MKFILGKKLEMTQKFDENGTVVPVTVVQAGPCVVSQVKTKEKDGYEAIQIGFDEKKKINKTLAGHLKGLFNARSIKEIRVSPEEISKIKRGQKITAAAFEKGDKISVTGTSKGKGFQGVVKRHGFKGQPTTHGTKDQVRMPGSIGATGPAHVFKGTRMPGRMGGDNVTISNLEIVDIDIEKGILYIKGAVPGARNGVLKIVGPGEMDLEEKAVKSKDAEQKEQTEAPDSTEQSAPKQTEEKESAEPKKQEDKGSKDEKPAQEQKDTTEKQEVKDKPSSSTDQESDKTDEVSKETSKDK